MFGIDQRKSSELESELLDFFLPFLLQVLKLSCQFGVEFVGVRILIDDLRFGAN